MRGSVLCVTVFLLCSCTGVLEREMAELRKTLREMNRESAEGRLRQEELANRVIVLESELARRPGSPAPASPPATAGKDASDPPGLPTVRLVPGAVEPAATVSSPPSPGSAPKPAPPPEPIPDLPAKDLYARGLAAFRENRLDEALRVFAAFAERFPDHTLTDNAVYWTGRALARRKDPAGARQAYERVVRRYPTGNKVPDALLALADVLSEIGKREDARTTLTRVVRSFPASEAAKDAARRLREMKP